MGLAQCFELREALLDVSEISLLPEKLLGRVQRKGPERSEISGDEKSQNHCGSSMTNAMNVYAFSKQKNYLTKFNHANCIAQLQSHSITDLK